MVTWKEHPLDRCEGQIITAFRELKGVYEKLRTDLDDATKRISTLQTVLMQAPADFRYPSSAIPFDKLQKRPDLIQEALENAQAEDVERLRSEYDGPARLGNFQPLMSKARDLLEEPRKPLMLLLSSVITVENAVTEYRKRLLEDPQLFRSQRSREALAHALGVAGPKPLTFTDIEDAGSLVAAQALVKAHTQGNSAEGEALLHGAGVSFDRWCAIVAALDDGRDPDLALQEADALVRRGLIQRTYRLGERS
ncbi:hypothetical protein ACW7BC_22070 [Azospirillum argentinense]